MAPRADIADAPTLSVSPRAPAQTLASDRRLALYLTLAWLLLMLVAYLGLRQPGVMMNGQRLSKDRAMFLAVNAGTLTGFQQSVGMDEFNPDSASGPGIVLTLVTAGTAFTLIAGGLALVRIVGLSFSPRQLVVGAVSAIALAAVSGAAVMIGPHRPLYPALLQSCAAFGNCGLAAGPIPTLFNIRTTALLLLAIAGGLGLPSLMELYDALWQKRRLLPHTLATLRGTAAVYLVGLVALLLFQLPFDRFTQWPAWQQALASSSVEAINSRTAGLHVESIAAIPRSAQWVMVMLMMVGSGSAGAGGGLKVTTLLELRRGGSDALLQRGARRSFGIALAWLGVYLLLVILGFLSMLALEPNVPADRLFFLVVSAASNVGLSHDPVSVVGPALCLLTLLMILGRLAPLAILWWMASTVADAEVAIG